MGSKLRVDNIHYDLTEEDLDVNADSSHVHRNYITF